jgi:hypothetical protein
MTAAFDPSKTTRHMLDLAPASTDVVLLVISGGEGLRNMKVVDREA